MGGKVTPSAVLVIQNGCTKLVNIKNQDSITKILDMVPDFVNKFTNKNSSKQQAATDESAKKEAAQELAEQLNVSTEEE